MIIKIDDLISQLVDLKLNDNAEFIEVFILEPFELEPNEWTGEQLCINYADGFGGCVDGFDIEEILSFNWSYKNY